MRGRHILTRAAITGATLALATLAAPTAQASEAGAAACTWRVTSPAKSGAYVKATASTSGCTAGSRWHAVLQWKNFLGSWTNLDTANWSGNNSGISLTYRCTPDEIEIYRAIIDRSDGESRTSSEKTITC